MSHSPSLTSPSTPHYHQQGEQVEEQGLTNVRLKVGGSSLKNSKQLPIIGNG